MSSLLVLYGLAAPPIGAIYFRQITLPVLGEQNAWFYVRNAREAHIELNGPVRAYETIRYWQEDDGTLRFELGQQLRDVLKRMRTTLVEARYDARADRAIVRVRPPLVGTIDLSMDRVYPERRSRPVSETKSASSQGLDASGARCPLG